MRFFRRRKFIIDKKLQYTLFLISMAYVVLFFLVLTLSLFVPLIIEIDKPGETSSKALQAAKTLLFLHDHIWLPGLLCLLAVGIHSIRTSHKISGPIYIFDKALVSIRQGIIPTPLRSLRKGDYLTNEFELINQMLESLRTNIKAVQTADADLNKSISLCIHASGDVSKEELLEKLKDVCNKGTQLEERIGYFTIES